MKKEEFTNLKVGEKVVLINHGKNKGKMGIVKEIIRDNYGSGSAYLEPVDCEFEVKYSRKTNKDGLYGWNQYGIGYPKRLSDERKFYIASLYGKHSISWSTENFTSKELITIDRFLKELNNRIDGVSIESIVITDKED